LGLPVSNRVSLTGDTMSRMKRFAEDVSVEMGHDGEINDEVLQEADRRLKQLPNLPKGDTEVWYMRDAWFSRGIMGEEPNPHDLQKTHILLGKIGLTDLEEIFAAMQGENWSPNGEAKMLILGAGLGHTSMSVGDVVRIGDKIWLCKNTGWKSLT